VDGETGYLVDQSDIPDLAGKIVRLLGDPKLRARLGCNGLERLQRKFSFAQFYSRMANLLDKLAA
jgi:glycosyltransferase involved in cell wall biosynthesis